MNWKKTKDEHPKFRIKKNGNHYTQECSIELLLTDGDTVWHEYYSQDDPDLSTYATHWVRVDEIEMPKN